MTVPAVNADGASNGYTAIQEKFRRLQMATDLLSERAETLAARMQRNAQGAVDLAEMCATAEVDARHVAKVGEIATVLAQVALSARGVQSAADRVGTATRHVAAEHQGEYGPVHAAATASPVRQARPGFYQPS